jgi:hypothetical protein
MMKNHHIWAASKISVNPILMNNLVVDLVKQDGLQPVYSKLVPTYSLQNGNMMEYETA